jgi:PEP-CTERM motif
MSTTATTARLIAGLGVLLSASVATRPMRASSITILSTATTNGYTFTNFDFSPLTGTATGSNVNGISNTGQVVGTTVDAGGVPTGINFSGSLSGLTELNTGMGQVAFGIDSAGDVVGGNGMSAFFLPNAGTLAALITPSGAVNAFGINDDGNIVGQFASGNNTPGFILGSSASNAFTIINAPTGIMPDVVNAQGINDNGLVVGFYLGNDGQVHGFTTQMPGTPGTVTGTAVADPIIPAFSQEAGATFVFSQILGVNDSGLAVGYYGDSTGSQHGYLYNTTSGPYKFLDDPAAAFDNGVEVTQITGINNSGEIAGFYSDANGTFHSFVATVAVPEPGSLLLAALGLVAIGWRFRRRMS